MMNNIKTFFLSIQSYLLLFATMIIGLLVIVLKFKEFQLQKVKIQLLQNHYDKEEEIFQATLNSSHIRIKASRERLNNALKIYNSPTN